MNLAIVITGEEGLGIRPVCDTLLTGFNSIGIQADSVNNTFITDNNTVIVMPGMLPNISRHCGPVISIDPMDGWPILTPGSVGARNKFVKSTFGLSRYSCNALKSAGIKEVKWLPLAADLSTLPLYPKPLDAVIPNLPNNIDFWFFNASVPQARKGVNDLIDAFIAAKFPKNVGLIIKCRMSEWATAPKKVKNKNIVMIDYLMSKEDLLGVMKSVNCVIVPSKLEGWGLIGMEGISALTPTILTAFSGHLDYATNDNAMLIPCNPEPIPESAYENGLIKECAEKMLWGVPKQKDIIAQMKNVINNDCSNLLLGAQKTAKWFTDKYTAMVATTAIESYGLRLKRKDVVYNNTKSHIAVCIPTLNYDQQLDNCLHSLLKTFDVSLEAIIYNDGKFNPNSVHTDAFPFKVTSIGECVNKGLPYSRQQLVNCALNTNATHMCFLDSDIIINDPLWLAKLLFYHNDGITGPLLMTPDRKIWGAGGTFTGEGKPTVLYHMQVPTRAGTPLVGIPRAVPHVPGACMFMKMDIWKSGLVKCDLNYGKRWYDDTDICFQVTENLGQHCWYRPEVTLIHDAWCCRKHTNNELDAHSNERIISQKVFDEKWGNPPALTYGWQYKAMRGEY